MFGTVKRLRLYDRAIEKQHILSCARWEIRPDDHPAHHHHLSSAPLQAAISDDWSAAHKVVFPALQLDYIPGEA